MTTDPADHTDFVLEAKAWAAFTAMLDRPPAPNPRLVALFARPSPFPIDPADDDHGPGCEGPLNCTCAPPLDRLAILRRMTRESEQDGLEY